MLGSTLCSKLVVSTGVETKLGLSPPKLFSLEVTGSSSSSSKKILLLVTEDGISLDSF